MRRAFIISFFTCVCLVLSCEQSATIGSSLLDAALPDAAHDSASSSHPWGALNDLYTEDHQAFLGDAISVLDGEPVISQNKNDVALLGDPTALKMIDNLPNVVKFVQTKHPGAKLFSIVGEGLKLDGTIDVTFNYTSMWSYGFRLSYGTESPATLYQIIFSKQAGTQKGMYLTQTDILPPSESFTNEDLPKLLDPTQLVKAFYQEKDCLALAQSSEDRIAYGVNNDGPFFSLENWRDQSYQGHPITGQAKAKCSN